MEENETNYAAHANTSQDEKKKTGSVSVSVSLLSLSLYSQYFFASSTVVTSFAKLQKSRLATTLPHISAMT